MLSRNGTTGGVTAKLHKRWSIAKARYTSARGKDARGTINGEELFDSVKYFYHFSSSLTATCLGCSLAELRNMKIWPPYFNVLTRNF